MPERVTTIAQWQVQALRFSAFLHRPLPDSSTAWRDATDTVPDIQENRAKEGLARQIGPYAGGQLEAQVTAVRADFVLTPPPPTSADIAVVIGAADEGLRSFDGLVERWLKGAPKTVRLAFGAVLMFRVHDREAAYANLAKLLRDVRVDAASMQELFYRVNRPRKSRTASELVLNRMTTWNSIRVRRFVTAAISSPNAPPITLAEEEYVRFEADNSTSADRGELLEPREQLPIYREMVEMAVENAEFGEGHE